MKKIIIIVLLLFTISCSNINKSIFEKYNDRFLEYHPDGYVWEEDWYCFTSVSLIISPDGSKIVKSVKFEGKIKFEKNSFTGTTSKFAMETEVVQFINDSEMIKTTTYDSLLNNYWYSYVTKDNQKMREEHESGRSNVNEFTISFAFDNTLFFPNELNKKNETSHISISEDLDYLSITSKKDNEKIAIEYLFKKNKINTIIRTKSINFENDNYSSYSDDATLKRIEPFYIKEQKSDYINSEVAPSIFNEEL